MSLKALFQRIFGEGIRPTPQPDPGGGWAPGSHAAQGDDDLEAHFGSHGDDVPERRWHGIRSMLPPDEMAKHGWRKVHGD
jgi:hypothetical protein